MPFAERELMLIKVSVNATARRDILDIADIFRAKAVDVSDHTITLQVSLNSKFRKSGKIIEVTSFPYFHSLACSQRH